MEPAHQARNFLRRPICRTERQILPRNQRQILLTGPRVRILPAPPASPLFFWRNFSLRNCRGRSASWLRHSRCKRPHRAQFGECWCLGGAEFSVRQFGGPVHVEITPTPDSKPKANDGQGEKGWVFTNDAARRNTYTGKNGSRHD